MPKNPRGRKSSTLHQISCSVFRLTFRLLKNSKGLQPSCRPGMTLSTKISHSGNQDKTLLLPGRDASSRTNIEAAFLSQEVGEASLLFTHEPTARNSANVLGRDLVMGVSNANGIVPMREQTIGSDLSRYKILPPRAFAYNPMRINVGSIAMSRLTPMFWPVRTMCSLRAKDVLDPDYFDHLCNTHWWKHHINESGSGSVRQRIYYADLAALRVVIPPLRSRNRLQTASI